MDLATLPRKASTWVDIIHHHHVSNETQHALMGISNLAAYMADANAYIRLISDLATSDLGIATY